MNFLPAQLRKEEYKLYSHQSIEDLALCIQDKFHNKDSEEKNISGEFTSSFRFKMPSHELFSGNLGRANIRVEGEIFCDEHKRTVLSLVFIPNLISILFFYTVPISAIILLLGNNLNFDANHLFGVFAYMFTLPTLILVSTSYQRKRVRETFTELFNLNYTSSPVYSYN